MITYDGFNEAIIGFCDCWLEDHCATRVIYSYDKMIQVLLVDMTKEEAIEYIDFNILQAYLGPNTPIVNIDADADEVLEVLNDLITGGQDV